MKQKCVDRKSIFRFSFILFLVLLSSAGCAFTPTTSGVHNGDWSYRLPNHYEIWRVNSREIICGKKDGENSLSKVIDENYVLEFKHDNRYVCLKCIELTQDSSMEMDTSNPNFYIIDTIEDNIYGAYTNSEYEDKVKELGFVMISDWIQTSPIPKGASF